MKKEFLLAGLLLLSFTAFTACKDSDESELVGNWVKVDDFEGVGRAYGVTFTIGSNVYISTGIASKEYLNDLWMMDPNTRAWTQRASIQADGEEAQKRGYGVGFSVGNAGYVGLGHTYDETRLGDFWKFDPASNSWSRVADFGGSARHSAVAFVVNNKAYVGTGHDGNHLMDFWRYDSAADAWTPITSIRGSKRLGASSFVIGNTAYVVCGENNGITVNDFWAFNADSETWTEKRKIANVSTENYDDDYNIARRYAASFVMAGKAYITCGDSNSGSLRGDTWEYDPIADLWQQLTTFEGVNRAGALGFTANGRGYVTTGRGGSFYFDDTYEFLPTAKYDQYD